jgi:acyl carrier protein
MTQQEALTWIAELFEEPVENIQPETFRENIPGWDSLGLLNLMSGLDSNFNIQLPDGEVGQLKVVNDILAILRQHGVL